MNATPHIIHQALITPRLQQSNIISVQEGCCKFLLSIGGCQVIGQISSWVSRVCKDREVWWLPSSHTHLCDAEGDWVYYLL